MDGVNCDRDNDLSPAILQLCAPSRSIIHASHLSRMHWYSSTLTWNHSIQLHTSLVVSHSPGARKDSFRKAVTAGPRALRRRSGAGGRAQVRLGDACASAWVRIYRQRCGATCCSPEGGGACLPEEVLVDAGLADCKMEQLSGRRRRRLHLECGECKEQQRGE